MWKIQVRMQLPKGLQAAPVVDAKPLQGGRNRQLFQLTDVLERPTSLPRFVCRSSRHHPPNRTRLPSVQPASTGTKRHHRPSLRGLPIPIGRIVRNRSAIQRLLALGINGQLVGSRTIVTGGSSITIRTVGVVRNPSHDQSGGYGQAIKGEAVPLRVPHRNITSLKAFRRNFWKRVPQTRSPAVVFHPKFLPGPSACRTERPVQSTS